MSELEVVDDLSPTMPDIGSWPFKKWYSTDKTWYYHKTEEPSPAKYDRDFYSLLDPILRPICYFLHMKDIATTPSCIGHFYDRSSLKKGWNQLKSEERLIRRRGLSVKDSETGKQLLFKKKQYQLPWNTFEDFSVEVSAKQRIGYLGIIIPEKLEKLSEKLKEYAYSTSYTKIEHAADMKDGSQLFHVIVRAPDEEKQTHEWRLVTAFFHKLLNER